MADRVRAFLDSEIAGLEPKAGVGPVVVEILTQKGALYAKRVETVMGHHAKSPVSTEWLAAEFRREARRAANPLPEKNIDAAIELLGNLEQLDDVTRLIELLG